jgi:hypothetical protein
MAAAHESGSESEPEVTDLSDSDVVTKYRVASDIVNQVGAAAAPAAAARERSGRHRRAIPPSVRRRSRA